MASEYSYNFDYTPAAHLLDPAGHRAALAESGLVHRGGTDVPNARFGRLLSKEEMAELERVQRIHDARSRARAEGRPPPVLDENGREITVMAAWNEQAAERRRTARERGLRILTEEDPFKATAMDAVALAEAPNADVATKVLGYGTAGTMAVLKAAEQVEMGIRLTQGSKPVLQSRRNRLDGSPVAVRPVNATPDEREAFERAITKRNQDKRHRRSTGSTVDRDAARHAAKIEARKAKPKPFVDPDSVPEFSPSGDTYAFGVRTYNVADNEMGQLAVRRVIDAQLGKDRNPWCLIEYGPDGKLTESSKKIWKEYNRVPKQIAFNDKGEVIAFRADPPRARGMMARRDRSGSWWTLDSNTALEPPDELHVGGDGVPLRLPDPSVPGRTRLVLIGSKEHPLSVFRGNFETGRENVPVDKPITVQYERGTKRAFEPYELWDRYGQLKYRRTIKDGIAHNEVYQTYRDKRSPELVATYDLRQATSEEKAALKQHLADWEKANPGRNPVVDSSYYNTKPVLGDASEEDNIQGAFRYGIGGDGYVSTGRHIWYSQGRPAEITTYYPNGAKRFSYSINSSGRLHEVYMFNSTEKVRKGAPLFRATYHRNRDTGVLEKQEDAKGGNVRSDAKGGNASGVPAGSSVPPDYRGPRIVVNPSTFRNEKDALCVAFNEAFRIVMEDMGFEPVSEPTDEQRKFFSDTAYANDELQMRRTILARICTFDTSVRRPTDEQLQEAVEFLENVMEAGYPQNEWEQSAVQRMHDMISQVPMGQQEEQPPEEQPPEEQPPEEQPPEEQPPEEQPPEERADVLGGETFDDKAKLAGVRAPGAGRPEDVDAAEGAAHDELLAQREEEPTGDSTRHERPEPGSPEAGADNAAPAQTPAERSFVQLPAFAVADGDPNQSTFREVLSGPAGAPGGSAVPDVAGQSFVQLPAFAGTGGAVALREVLNTPIGTPFADVEKAPGTPGAWQGGRYGVKKDGAGLPNSWKGGRY